MPFRLLYPLLQLLLPANSQAFSPLLGKPTLYPLSFIEVPTGCMPLQRPYISVRDAQHFPNALSGELVCLLLWVRSVTSVTFCDCSMMNRTMPLLPSKESGSRQNRGERLNAA